MGWMLWDRLDSNRIENGQWRTRSTAAQTAAVHVGFAGDVYAHNIVVDASGKATLLDYGQCWLLQSCGLSSAQRASDGVLCITSGVFHAGASFFYQPDTLPYEAQEVRAFGLFLSDLIARMDGSAHGGAARQKLEGTASACLEPDPLKRPAFAAIAAALGFQMNGLHVRMLLY